MKVHAEIILLLSWIIFLSIALLAQTALFGFHRITGHDPDDGNIGENQLFALKMCRIFTRSAFIPRCIAKIMY
jgi:hypothetical protein